MDIQLTQSIGRNIEVEAGVYTVSDAEMLFSKSIRYAEGTVRMYYPLFMQMMDERYNFISEIQELKEQISELEASADKTTEEIWDRIVGAG